MVVSGTTGESPTLSTDEKLRLFSEIKEAIGERGAVIAGTGNYNTAESVELSQEAESAGADALLLVVPYYNKPPQEGLYQHFKTVAESVDIPCILYNVTSRTSLNMSHDTTIRLSHVDNIVGVKEAGSDMDQIARIIDGSQGGFRVWSGNDNETFYMMAMGGYGVVSVASHLVGSQIKQMMGYLLGGRRGEGRSRAPQAPPHLQGSVRGVQPHTPQVCAEQGRLQRGDAQTAPSALRRRLSHPDRLRPGTLRYRPAGWVERVAIPASSTCSESHRPLEDRFDEDGFGALGAGGDDVHLTAH